MPQFGQIALETSRNLAIVTVDSTRKDPFQKGSTWRKISHLSVILSCVCRFPMYARMSDFFTCPWQDFGRF